MLKTQTSALKIWLFFTLFIQNLHAQGPVDGYLKGKGVLDVSPSFSVNRASSFAGARNQKYDFGFRGSLISIFAEYGLTENFDVVGTAAYVFTASQNGFQDGSLWAKYRLWHGKLGQFGTLHVLTSIGFQAPLSNYQPLAEGAIGTRAKIAPTRLILQLETPVGFFLNCTGGWNFRFDRLREEDIFNLQKIRPDYTPTIPADFSTFLFKIGFPTRRIYCDAWWEWQHTRGGIDYQFGVPDLPQAFGVSYQQVGGTFYYSETEKRGVFVSFGKILGGRNVSQVLRLTAGMVFKI